MSEIVALDNLVGDLGHKCINYLINADEEEIKYRTAVIFVYPENLSETIDSIKSRISEYYEIVKNESLVNIPSVVDIHSKLALSKFPDPREHSETDETIDSFYDIDTCYVEDIEDPDYELSLCAIHKLEDYCFLGSIYANAEIKSSTFKTVFPIIAGQKLHKNAIFNIAVSVILPVPVINAPIQTKTTERIINQWDTIFNNGDVEEIRAFKAFMKSVNEGFSDKLDEVAQNTIDYTKCESDVKFCLAKVLSCYYSSFSLPIIFLQHVNTGMISGAAEYIQKISSTDTNTERSNAFFKQSDQTMYVKIVDTFHSGMFKKIAGHRLLNTDAVLIRVLHELTQRRINLSPAVSQIEHIDVSIIVRI